MTILWSEVERIGRTLPEVEPGEAHEGSPALVVRGRQFARLRYDEERELLQFWVAEPDLVQAYVQSDSAVYTAIPGFSKKVVLARLDRLDTSTARELLVESWACRVPVSLRKAHPDLR